MPGHRCWRSAHTSTGDCAKASAFARQSKASIRCTTMPDGIVTRRHRKVRSRKVWTTADADAKVCDQEEMQHLLGRHRQNDFTPPLDSLPFLNSQPRLSGALEAEAGIQVTAHQCVLDLRGLCEQMKKLLSGSTDDVGVGRVVAKTESRLRVGRHRNDVWLVRYPSVR
jgi:hypothetical protein